MNIKIKTIIGAVIGLIGGYLISHYMVSPFLFGSPQSKQDTLLEAIQQEIQAEKNQLPLRIDEHTTLISVDQRDLHIAYTYTLNDVPNEQNSYLEFSKEKTKQLCTTLKSGLAMDIKYDYFYRDQSGQPLFSFPINKDACSITSQT